MPRSILKMPSYTFKHALLRFIAIALVSCWLVVAFNLLYHPLVAQTLNHSSAPESSTSQPAERTKAFPYPTQLVPGQTSPCIVLDQHADDDDELTPQEEYAEENWTFTERWAWRQLCAGKEVNFHRKFVRAWLLQNDDYLYLSTKPVVLKPLLNDIQNDLDISTNSQWDNDFDSWERLINENPTETILDLLVRKISESNHSITTSDIVEKLKILLKEKEVQGKEIQNFIREKWIETYPNSDLNQRGLSENLRSKIIDHFCKEEDGKCSDSFSNLLSLNLNSDLNRESQPDLLSFILSEIETRGDILELIEISWRIRSTLNLLKFKNYEFFKEHKIEEISSISSDEFDIQNLKIDYDAFLNYQSDNGVFPNRKAFQLDSNFLRSILTIEPFQSALPNKVWINGAFFSEGLDLSSSNINQELRLNNSTFGKQINLTNASFFRDLYFDKSIFKENLIANEIAMGGSLFLRNIIFTKRFNTDDYIDEENSEENNSKYTLINLESFQGEDIILSGNLSDSSLDLSNAILNDLQLIPNINLYHFSLAETSDSNEKGSIRVESKQDDSKQTYRIHIFDLSGVEHPSILIQEPEKSDDQESKESDERMNKLFELLDDAYHDNFSNIQKNNILLLKISSIYNFPILADIASQLLFSNEEASSKSKFIHLTGAQINSFDIQFSEKIINTNGEEFNSARQASLRNLQSLPEYDVCHADLRRFQYQKASELGFRLLKECLESKYNHIQTDSNGNKNIVDDEFQHIALLQPFEQAASVARVLGRYKDENELLYKRKRLEVTLERIQEGRLSPDFIRFSIEDFIYGFGYYRFKALILFLIAWYFGILLSCRIILKKQNILVRENIEVLDEQDKFSLASLEEDSEIQLEKDSYSLRDHEAIEIRYELLFNYLDSISRVVLQEGSKVKIRNKFNKRETFHDRNALILFVQFNHDFNIKEKFEKCLHCDSDLHSLNCHHLEHIKNHCVKVGFLEEAGFDEKKQLETVIKSAIELTQKLNERKVNFNSVGLLTDFWPNSGIWAVIPQTYRAKLMRDPQKCKNIFAKYWRSFRHFCIKGYQFSHKGKNNEIVPIIRFKNDRNCITYEYPIGYFRRKYYPLRHALEDDFRHWCCRLIFLVLVCVGTYVPSTMYWRFIFFLVLFLVFPVSIILLITPSWGWGWRIVWSSALFSFDNLLPIINLDEKLHSYIFDDSEGVTRFFFQIQKLLAVVLASILLPIFFIAGFN